jgi:hypothetical protein
MNRTLAPRHEKLETAEPAALSQQPNGSPILITPRGHSPTPIHHVEVDLIEAKAAQR